jgi:NTP pyrophosphatase (non-canonical NTP hydrolase)
MNLDEYQKEASRTECDQRKSLGRMAYDDIDDNCPSKYLKPIRMNHALIGLISELGELAKLFENWIYYGGDEPNTSHLLEEVGDVMWRLAELCNAMGIRLQCAIDANIAKLKVRYPEKWTGEKADRANRNKEAERNAIVEIMEKSVTLSGHSTTSFEEVRAAVNRETPIPPEKHQEYSGMDTDLGH